MQKKMLLLSCCGPCSAGIIKKLALGGRGFSVLFYNPNIDTAVEYKKRLLSQKQLCAHFNIHFIDLPYTPDVWQAAITGLETAAERGPRCYQCFYLRLKTAAQYAKQNGFDCFSSVLGISRYKDMEQVNLAAAAAAQEIGIDYDFTNWRKGGSDILAREVIKELALYCQKYCGCQYSKII